MSKLVSVLILILCLPSICFCEKNDSDSNSDDTFYVLFPVKMRDQPSLDGGIIEPLNQGDKLIVLSYEGTWYKVQTESGKIGYVATNWVVNYIQLAKQKALNEEKNKELEIQRKREVDERNIKLNREIEERNRELRKENFIETIKTVIRSFTVIGIACVLILFSLITLLMPIFIWQIKKQVIKINKQLEDILEVIRNIQVNGNKETKTQEGISH